MFWNFKKKMRTRGQVVLEGMKVQWEEGGWRILVGDSKGSGACCG